ncbi:hypothetical protein [Krasilnikovia sp. MM14-A1259]|uniref:hypothetical protein n=1 Tax=Krasilnikovia sp. MM14-A1259 TaxID=3373539 RepID=UPI0037FB083E
MPPTPLSQWADRQGIPRRTAYNWAKSGKLRIPLHRTLTGRLMVLDDDEDAPDAEAHPFVAAYAEALSLPVGTHTGDFHYSEVLEAWGVNLYEAVDSNIRPAVLHLAMAAACGRPKRDVLFRMADWLGRVELADWYESAGLPEPAGMLRERPEIKDADSFLDWWPTGVGSFKWRDELEEAVNRGIEAADAKRIHGGRAVESLAEESIGALEQIPLAIRRDKFRLTLDRFARLREGNKTVKILGPDRGDLWDIRALYADPMWALGRPAARRTARLMCQLLGWDADAPMPSTGHPLWEIGLPACQSAAVSALTPYVHDAHMREIDAFRRIAFGRPFDLPISRDNGGK